MNLVKAVKNRPMLLIAPVVVAVAAVFVLRSPIGGAFAASEVGIPVTAEFTGSRAPGGEIGGVLTYRADGTPVFSTATLVFTDPVVGEVSLPRPAVSHAEADRLGYSENMKEAGYIYTYIIKGPVERGFSDADAIWLTSIIERHEDPDAQLDAFRGMVFALAGPEAGFKPNTYSKKSRARLIETYEGLLDSANSDLRLAAISSCTIPAFQEEAPGIIETMQRIARDDENETLRELARSRLRDAYQLAPQ